MTTGHIIRILLLAADPSDHARLRLGQEFREIKAALQMATQREQFALESRESVRVEDISQAVLQAKPQIIHFSGHGNNIGELCFEDWLGKAQSLKIDALAALFEAIADQVTCVLLNACYSEIQAKAIVEHISFVIGMSQEIGDKAAIAFATGFYRALGGGSPFEKAYKLGCAEIGLRNLQGQCLPVLHRQERCEGSQESDKTQWVIVLSGTVDEVNRARAEVIVDHLSQLLGNASLTLKKIEKGSIKLYLEGSQEDFEVIEELFRSGRFTEIQAILIEDVALADAVPIPSAEGSRSDSNRFKSASNTWTKPADRLGTLPPYVFARLDELKLRAREQGLDLIDLGMGNPDGSTPQPVVEAAITAIQNPANHGYPPFEGTASFRRTITDWYYRHYNVKLDPESEALPLLGSKEGLTHLALAYVNPGDTVLVPSPACPAHFRGPLIAGANIHSLILSPDNGWLIDVAAIPEAIARQAKILYFNYPNNPTAATAPREFFEEIVAFARHYEILLVHDLCYAELAFDGYQPTSLLEIPGAKDIGVEFHTLSKTYSMAGWRVGFVVGNHHIIQGLRTLKTNLDYGIFAALQTAAETALQLPDVYLHEVQARYRTRRDFLIQGLAELGWTVPKSNATMYLWVDCPPGTGSTDFALTVLQETGVVVTPGNAFGIGGEGYVRISLIADCDRLGEALRRMRQAGIRYPDSTHSRAFSR